MAFIAKPDYFGLATSQSGSLSLKSSSLNKSASVAEATDEKGDVVAEEVFGEQASPSVTYELKADLALSGIKLGAVTTVDSKPYVLLSIGFNTAPAGVPEVQCSGEMVETGATTANSTTISLPSLTLQKWHDAQILGLAFTLSGTGCYLNGCNYSAKCDVTKATVDGTIVAQFRCHIDFNLRQSESTDGGKTWTPVHRLDIHGHPPHLIRLADDKLVTVYGVRDGAFGEYACISDDNGKTWDVKNQIKLAGHWCGDLGYPASVQLPDGSIITVYYQAEKIGEKTCLMATRWRVK